MRIYHDLLSVSLLSRFSSVSQENYSIICVCHRLHVLTGFLKWHPRRLGILQGLKGSLSLLLSGSWLRCPFQSLVTDNGRALP